MAGARTLVGLLAEWSFRYLFPRNRSESCLVKITPQTPYKSTDEGN